MALHVLVTGATGFLGQALIARLTAAGHAVAALARDPERTRARLPVLQASYPWPAVDLPPPPEAFRGVNAVVHLAGENISGRWTPRKKAAIRESRVAGTQSLVRALEHLPERPACLVCASAIGYYGDRGEEILTERSTPGRGFLARVCQDWEAAAACAEDLGMRVVRLRIGMVLERGGGALEALLPVYRWGLGGPLGGGRQWWSWISRLDLVRMIVFALETGASGILNATAPQPIRQRAFAHTLAAALGRRAFLPAPACALHALLGEFAGELLTSQRAVPQAIEATGFAFEHPDLERALGAILERS